VAVDWKGGMMVQLCVLEELTFEITQKCPMNCIHCSSEGGPSSNNEFSLNDAKSIINQAIDLGVKHINLSGGEPLIFPKFLELCQYIKNHGLILDIYSCGNQAIKNCLVPINEEFLNNLKEIGVDKLIFSIHGSSSQEHDNITQRRGSFPNLITSIKRSMDVHLKVELHFVPTRINYHSLPKIVNLAKTLNVECLSILRFVPQGRGRLNNELLEIKETEVLELKDILTVLKENNKDFIRIGSPFNCFQISGSTKCMAGINKATIKPDGHVFPCVSMKDFSSVDDDNNLRKETLSNIWKDSTLFNDTRKYLESNRVTRCNNCADFYKCKGGCYTQNQLNNFNKDPYCLRKSDKNPTKNLSTCHVT
jgi:radical SAM protein with 4Fe4S-binding SPASM domain